MDELMTFDQPVQEEHAPRLRSGPETFAQALERPRRVARLLRGNSAPEAARLRGKLRRCRKGQRCRSGRAGRMIDCQQPRSCPVAAAELACARTRWRRWWRR